MDRAGQDRIGQDRTAQDSTGQDKTGQDRTEHALKHAQALEIAHALVPAQDALSNEAT